MPVKILLADKSITIQKVVEMLFSGRDYEVVCVSDGESALKEAARVLPDVALVDVDLPRIDGYAFAERLKQVPRLEQMPVILMMSRDDVYDGAKGKQAGILDSIAKPFESQELIGKVRKALAGAPRTTESAQPAARQQAEPVPQAVPGKAKKASPSDIFDIISEAPTQAELARAAAPFEEESVYEVEPVVEEVEEPLAREGAKALPIGSKAVEEMRAGLGLTERQDEPQPEIVTFESLAKAVESEKKAPTPPSPAPLVSRPPTPPAPAPASAPAPAPALPEGDLRKIAQETIEKMAKELFKSLPPPPMQKISDDTIRRGIEDAVSKIAREIAREVIEKVAWEVIPQLAEVMIKEEIERLKAEM